MENQPRETGAVFLEVAAGPWGAICLPLGGGGRRPVGVCPLLGERVAKISDFGRVWGYDPTSVTSLPFAPSVTASP